MARAASAAFVIIVVFNVYWVGGRPASLTAYNTSIYPRKSFVNPLNIYIYSIPIYSHYYTLEVDIYVSVCYHRDAGDEPDG